MFRNRSLILSLLLVLSLLVAACGAPGATTPAAADAPSAAPSTAADAPAEEVAAAPAASADTDTLTETVATTETAAADTAPTTDTAPAESAAVPATVRTFAIDPAQSSASYEVEEEFLGQAVPFVQTVGSTSAIDGQIAFAVDGAALTDVSGTVNVDLRTLASDSGRRDNAIRDRWLESNTYPLATFNATGVSDLPADAALGADVSFKLNGDLTIREITTPFTWDVTANLADSTLSGTATGFLLMADYGFEAPDIAGMLRVTDGVTVTVNFVANEVE